MCNDLPIGVYVRFEKCSRHLRDTMKAIVKDGFWNLFTFIPCCLGVGHNPKRHDFWFGRLGFGEDGMCLLRWVAGTGGGLAGFTVLRKFFPRMAKLLLGGR